MRVGIPRPGFENSDSKFQNCEISQETGVQLLLSCSTSIIFTRVNETNDLKNPLTSSQYLLPSPHLPSLPIPIPISSISILQHAAIALPPTQSHKPPHQPSSYSPPCTTQPTPCASPPSPSPAPPTPANQPSKASASANIASHTPSTNTSTPYSYSVSSSPH